MNKEMKMLTARQLKAQGLKQHQIAEVLGVTERTVRNYLTGPPGPRKKVKRKSKLDPFKPFIKSILKDVPDYNREILFERLKNMGYPGKISILRDYAKMVTDEINTKAVIRFETEPARQAQVDWKEFRMRRNGERARKVYAFCMTMGYSRKSFVFFTESMKQSVLHLCHKKAFAYFGGVPKEILYDNMKTAFIHHGNGIFKPNKNLLSFATHYGFIPRRCRIKRPQTKGKVERVIGYLQGNFWPRVKGLHDSVDELNQAVHRWLALVDEKVIRDLGNNRKQRFERERFLLTPLPAVPYDCREVYHRMVSRESLICFESNKYSVPPSFIGKMVNLFVNHVTREAELRFEGHPVRVFKLKKHSCRHKHFFKEDREQLLQLWLKQNTQKRITTMKQQDVEVRHPGFYEKLLSQEAAV